MGSAQAEVDASRPAAYQLFAMRVLVTLILVVTACVVASFVYGWTQATDRPWFPMLAVVAVIMGAVALRAPLRRPHTLLIVPDAGVLRAKGIRHRVDVRLADLESLLLVERTVHGAEPTGRAEHTPGSTGGRRLDLVIGTSDEKLLVNEGRRTRWEPLRSFAEGLSAAAGVALTTSQRASVRGTPAHRLYSNARSLKPHTGPRTIPHLVAKVLWWLVAVSLLFAVPIAFLAPPYELPVSDLATVEATLGAELDERGAGDLDPVPVDVSFHERACRREQEWFWGGSHGVARLGYTTSVPIDTEGTGHVAEKLDSDGIERSEGVGGGISGYFRVGAGGLVDVTVDDGTLTVSSSTWCLHTADRTRAEPVVEEATGRFIAWLTTTSLR